jgi:hypothetical protein
MMSRIRDRRESGTILLLVALSVFVVLGMAAFAVDMGWLFYNQVRTRKAAEAAALAGVVYLPLPSGTAFGPGTDPFTTALDIAGRHGTWDSVTPSLGAHSAQLNVAISETVGTFFMKAFGIDTVQIDQDATAEHIPPLKIGSDEPYLGEDPTVSGRDRDFFLAISGEDRGKGQGDEFAARRLDSGGSSPQYVGDGNPAYHYAFEVPAGSALIGGTLEVQVFDPQPHDEGAVGNGGPNGLTNDWVLEGGDDAGRYSATRFRVFQPDQTPGTWLDNNVLVPGCDRTFRGRNANGAHADYDPLIADTWVTVCSVSGVQSGIYVVDVMSDHPTDPDGDTDTDHINGYSVRGAFGGGSPVMSSSDLQAYALGRMSLWQFNTGSNPVFKIAKLDEVYAGSELILTLWDISDIGANGTLQFVGSVSGGTPLDCLVRTRSQTGQSPSAWGADDGQTNCYLTFAAQEFNNRYVEFRFDVPSTYTCPAGDGSSPSSPGCWIFVSYGVSAGITDRTTWSAKVDGQPIHLLP